MEKPWSSSRSPLSTTRTTSPPPGALGSFSSDAALALCVSIGRLEGERREENEREREKERIRNRNYGEAYLPVTVNGPVHHQVIFSTLGGIGYRGYTCYCVVALSSAKRNRGPCACISRRSVPPPRFVYYIFLWQSARNKKPATMSSKGEALFKEQENFLWRAPSSPILLPKWTDEGRTFFPFLLFPIRRSIPSISSRWMKAKEKRMRKLMFHSKHEKMKRERED